MGRVGASHASASSLVARSATTTAAAVPQNTRRSTTLAIFLLGLALDAEPCMRQRVEPLEQDVLPALLALAELLGRLIQPPSCEANRNAFSRSMASVPWSAMWNE